LLENPGSSAHLQIASPPSRDPIKPSSTLLQLFSRLVLPAALIAFSAPFLALLFYSVPASDDFCKATLSFNCVPQPGVLQITWLYYTQWSPRWLTTLLQSFVMNRVDLVSAYGWLLLSVIICNLAALWYFFRTYFEFSRGTALLASASFFAAWIASIPSPEEAIFWLTGAMEYYLSFGAMLLLLGLLHKKRGSIWYYLSIALLSIAVPAQHEIAGTFLCAVLLAGVILMQVQQRPGLHWKVSFGFALLSQAVVMMTPGNKIRAAQEHRHLWDFAHLPKWIAHSFYHGFDWLSYPAFLLAACCILLLWRQGRGKQDAANIPPRWIGLLCLLGMLVILCEYCLVELASGNWSPNRVVSWFAFVFCLLFVCLVLTGIPELARVEFSVATRTGIYLLFAVSLLGSANFRAAVEDLGGTAQAWRRIDAAQLRQRGGAVVFELPARYPKLSMHQQVTSDSGCWVNRCLANYLHATQVVGKDSNEECPH
jgi:hypothetical protein